MDISTGFTALSAAMELAKGIKNIDDRVKLNAAVIELQEKILTAQEAAASSRRSMEEMQATIDAFDRWESTAEKYALRDFGCETYAYQAKDEFLGDKPRHLACPNCFANRRLSVLQYDDTYIGRRRFTCQACDKHVDLGCHRVSGGSSYAETDWTFMSD